jgi:cob(I)alamin adenosyltransferase
MKIYTRTGDDGTTGLLGGRRVSKADLRVEAYGDVDEANAALGLARAVGLPAPLDVVLARAQSTLFQVGAALATPPDRDSGTAPVAASDVAALESAIDAIVASLAPLQSFILPGGAEGAARLHLARTVCRRAERAVVALASRETVDPLLVRYLNRLSDLLFVQARAANHAAGVADVPWKGGSS